MRPNEPQARDRNPFGGENEQTERGGGEFWPAQGGGDEGQAILGRVSDLRKIKTKFGPADVATFSPCVVRKRNGDKELFGEVQVLLSTYLQSRIRAHDIGKVLAVVYDGKEKQPGGADAHVFRVFDSQPAKLDQELRAFDSDLPF